MPKMQMIVLFIPGLLFLCEEVSLSICGQELAEEREKDELSKLHSRLSLDQIGSVHLLNLTTDNSTTWPINHSIRCSLSITTCASCILKVTLANTAIQAYPERQHAFYDFEYDCDTDTPSNGVPCFNVQLTEMRADFGLSAIDQVYRRQSLWTDPVNSSFVSSANSLTITISMWHLKNNSRLAAFAWSLFPLTVTVIDGSVVMTGSSNDSHASNGFIDSPRFPDAYPRGSLRNFTLINTDKRGFVRLVFDDFHLHFLSELRVLDSDGKELINTRRDRRRPSALQSRGPLLHVLFNARDYSQLVGFRGRYEFVSDSNWPDQPSPINCDGDFEGFGGVIELMPVKNAYVDCVWLIGRLQSVTFERLYLKVEQFDLQGMAIRLEVREGTSSVSDRRLLLQDTETMIAVDRGTVHSDDETSAELPTTSLPTLTTRHVPAFYVRLRGLVHSSTGLRLVYTQFYQWATALCPGGFNEFHCDNGRCIRASLRCDRVDNCGDESDELCAMDSVQGFVTSDGSYTGAIVIIVSCGAVLCSMAMVATVFARLHRSRRLLRPLGQQQLQRHSVEIDDAQSSFSVLPEVVMDEAPPSYDDALKHKSPAEMMQSQGQERMSEHGCDQHILLTTPGTSSSSVEEHSRKKKGNDDDDDDIP